IHRISAVIPCPQPALSIAVMDCKSPEGSIANRRYRENWPIRDIFYFLREIAGKSAILNDE
ncbi:hypothetical protein J8J32_22100, partial [Mycobacterium tuberculosis]|nr:hypothetical protein [Mycobacterium tuberculosis]